MDLIHSTQLPLNCSSITPLLTASHCLSFGEDFSPKFSFSYVVSTLCMLFMWRTSWDIPFHFSPSFTQRRLHPKYFILYADNWDTSARFILLIYFFPHYFCAQIAYCSQVLNCKSLPLTCSLDNLLVSWGSLVSSQGPVLQLDLSITSFKSSESSKHLFCYLGHVWTSSPRNDQAKQVPEYPEILNKQQNGAIWAAIQRVKRSTFLFASNYEIAS